MLPFGPVIILVLGSTAVALGPLPDVRLENDLYRVEVERTHGRITQILDKVGQLELIGEPRLADNYKFTLPLPGKHSNIDATEGNYIVGRDQKLHTARISGKTLELLWKAPLKSQQGHYYDIDVVMQIELQGPRIILRLKIDNRSPYPVGEVWHPMLGGLIGLGDRNEERKATLLALPTEPIRSAMKVGGNSAAPLFSTVEQSGFVTTDIFREFGNFCDLGTLVPERFYGYPTNLFASWAELSLPGKSRGVYFAAHDVLARFKVQTVDPGRPLYQQTLVKYVCRNPWGNVYPGVYLDPGFPEVRRMYAAAMKRLAAAGVDGIHIQRLFPMPLDFGPALKASPDHGPWEGTLKFLKEVLVQSALSTWQTFRYPMSW
jgi:hypothetical protein